MRRCAGICLSLLLLVAAPLPAPQHVSATAKNGQEIVIAWTAVAQAASYNLYRGTSSHKETLYRQGIISPYFYNSSVTKGPTYYYQVAAVNRAGQVGARSMEVSASLAPASSHPVTHPVRGTVSSGMSWGTFLMIVALLLLGAGVALFAWQRTRARPITTATTAHLGGALPEGGVANFPSRLDAHPWEEGDGFVPEGVPHLPATIFPGEGLVARFGASVPPAMPGETSDALPPAIVPSISAMIPPRPYDAPSLPAPPMPSLDRPTVLENSEPLHELFNDGMGATTFAGGTGSPEPLVPNHLRQLGDSGRVPVWPSPPAGMGPEPPNSTRSLLFIIAGTCVVLGIMALVLFAFFAASTNSSTTISAPQHSTTAAGPSATPVPPSPSPSPTVVATPIAINAGGGAVGAFSGDTDFSGGTAATFSDPIDTSQVQNPAPQQVYQTERWGTDFTYTIPNLTPGATYTVRLHFAEDYFTDHPKGKRVFNVAINDQPVLTNFDIAATAGGADIAIVEQFPANALSDGTIRIHFTNGPANNAKINGIEILPNNQG